MHDLKNLTQAQKDKIAGILMDSHAQNTLLTNPNHPDVWMLDFVYDSTLRDAVFTPPEIASILTRIDAVEEYSPFNP